MKDQVRPPVAQYPLGRMSRLRRIVFGLLVVPLIALEALVMNGFILGLLFFLTAVLFNVGEFREGKRPDFVLSVMGAVAFTVVIFAWVANERIAAQQARQIVDACNEFKAKNGDYPNKLSDLVPQFMRAEPPGKYVFASHWSYGYLKNPSRPGLPSGHPTIVLFSNLPMRGRELLNFETGELHRTTQ